MSYNTAAIRELLTDAINDQELTALCFDYFRPVHRDFASGMGRLVKIQSLIDYCERHNQFDILLTQVQRTNPGQYSKFISLVQKPSRTPQGGIISSDKGQVKITLRGDFSRFTPELVDAAVGALSGVLNIPRDQINVLKTRLGSIILRIEMPTEAINRLKTLYKTGDPVIQDLGIQQVKIIHRQSSKITPIRSLLFKPFTMITFIITILFGCGVWFVWFYETPLDHPGPVIVGTLLTIILFISPFVWEMISGQEQTIQQLTLEKDTLIAEKEELLNSIEPLQNSEGVLYSKNLGSSPSIQGLELLVERWQGFEPTQNDSLILNEQFSIIQSIAKLKYSQAKEIRIIKYFHGFKKSSGAFLVHPGNDTPLVLKFDSMVNINQEMIRYPHCVKNRLSMTPGEPSIPPQVEGKISGEPWGAITYNLLDANQADRNRLQTFADYYLTTETPQQIIDGLGVVFEALRPWWKNSTGPGACEQWYKRTLYSEYDRLTDKQRRMQKGITDACEALAIRDLQQVTFDQEYVNLEDGLRLRNPLNWVEAVFAEKRVPNWITQANLRRDSIVHGDLHAGNILISTDDQGQLRAWAIDFPHTHVGPTIQDLARLEADLKFSTLTDDMLQGLTPAGIYDFENILLPEFSRPEPILVDLTPTQLPKNLQQQLQLEKIWQTVHCLREEASNYMMGNDARPYYLALLHATLPTLYYGNRSSWQKLYTFISAARLCEFLSR